MGSGLVLPRFQFSGLWPSTCRFPRLKAFLSCLCPCSSWWYQFCAVLCLGCSVVMLGHFSAPWGSAHQEICLSCSPQEPEGRAAEPVTAQDLFVLQRGEQQNLWQHRRWTAAAMNVSDAQHMSACSSTGFFLERDFTVHHMAFACSLTGLWARGNLSTHFWMLFAGSCGIAAHGVDVHVHWGLNFWTPRLSQ